MGLGAPQAAKGGRGAGAWPGVGDMQLPAPRGPWGGHCPGPESGDRLFPSGCQGTRRGRTRLEPWFLSAPASSGDRCIHGIMIGQPSAPARPDPGPTRPGFLLCPPPRTPPSFLAPSPCFPSLQGKKSSGWLAVSISAPSASWPRCPPASEESSGIRKASWSWAGCGGL